MPTPTQLLLVHILSTGNQSLFQMSRTQLQAHIDRTAEAKASSAFISVANKYINSLLLPSAVLFFDPFSSSNRRHAWRAVDSAALHPKSISPLLTPVYYLASFCTMKFNSYANLGSILHTCNCNLRFD